MPYLSQESYQELHLPLIFDEVITSFQEKLSLMQEFLKKYPQATHRQLFEFISPVVSKFYKTLCERYKKEGIIESFKHICNSNYEGIYIEDIVQVTTESLLAKKPVKLGQLTVEELIQHVLKTTDLLKLKQLLPFLQFIRESLSDCIKPTELHASWRDEKILFRLLKERGIGRYT